MIFFFGELLMVTATLTSWSEVKGVSSDLAQYLVPAALILIALACMTSSRCFNWRTYPAAFFALGLVGMLGHAAPAFVAYANGTLSRAYVAGSDGAHPVQVPVEVVCWFVTKSCAYMMVVAVLAAVVRDHDRRGHHLRRLPLAAGAAGGESYRDHQPAADAAAGRDGGPDAVLLRQADVPLRAHVHWGVGDERDAHAPGPLTVRGGQRRRQVNQQNRGRHARPAGRDKQEAPRTLLARCPWL